MGDRIDHVRLDERCCGDRMAFSFCRFNLQHQRATPVNHDAGALGFSSVLKRNVRHRAIHARAVYFYRSTPLKTAHSRLRFIYRVSVAAESFIIWHADLHMTTLCVA
ncbi:hypothetical protein Agabi119p4_2580 [Agaricus bisporus var. burnettii]|uniref:Uncharacterized protein n=1 Tax=Agaricus bisporus var. burnettii TaxID=192524 RepID=A0A8H7F9S1_AGABI|nr:hypothetical protein Agabi119p4_2580 [Agaricus bisporus var. burnettii]